MNAPQTPDRKISVSAFGSSNAVQPTRYVTRKVTLSHTGEVEILDDDDRDQVDFDLDSVRVRLV